MRSMQSLRVVLADDHHFSREGLRTTLEADGVVVVGEASDGAAVVPLVASLEPDLVVLDVKMPGGTVAETIERIAKIDASVRIAVLTVSVEHGDVLSALLAGADSYLLKDAPAEQIVGAIRQTAAGSVVLSEPAAHALLANVASPGETAAFGEHLSERERDVLRLIVDGADNATIGDALSISRHTVKQHVTNIFGKLGVRTRVQAAVLAVREGLV
jgi:DNA-binding NarL/FixJ family response regulator